MLCHQLYEYLPKLQNFLVKTIANLEFSPKIQNTIQNSSQNPKHKPLAVEQ